LKAVTITLKTFLILIFFCGNIYAQGSGVGNTDYNRFSVDLNAGLMSHYGDIKENPYWPASQELSFGGGLGLNYHFSPVFTLRGNFLTGSLVGRNTDLNRHFENNFMELSVNSVFNFSQLFVPNSPNNERVSVYGVLGIGTIGYRTKLMTLDTDQVLNTYGYSADGNTAEDRHWDMVVPFGLGVKFRVSDRIDLGLETAFRYTQTDKLDAVNRVFSKNDMYNATTLGLTIRLGRNTNSAYWASAAQAMYPGDVQRMDRLANRYSEVQEKVVRIEQQMDAQDYDKDIAELRQMVQSLERKNNELTMRLHNMQEQIGTGTVAGTAALLSVYFRINSAALDATNYERVAAAARFLQANPEVKLELVGHTDHTGPDRFNMILSERRAKAVYDALVNDFRIDADRLSISYRGPADPQSQQNNSINRRVDFIVVE
jgi:outer membrane protein OmpA-like peptidoglycan-associated protein